MQFGKNKPFWGRICTTYERYVGINKSNLIGWSTVVLKKYPLCQFCSILVSKCRDLRSFLRVKFGSTVLLRVKELTFRNHTTIIITSFRLLRMQPSMIQLIRTNFSTRHNRVFKMLIFISAQLKEEEHTDNMLAPIIIGAIATVKLFVNSFSSLKLFVIS